LVAEIIASENRKRKQVKAGMVHSTCG